MASKGQKFNKYSLELKLKVTTDYLERGYSESYVSNKYNIPIGTIKTWAAKYRHTGTLIEDKRGRKKDVDIDYKERYEILKKYLKYLEEVDLGRK